VAKYASLKLSCVAHRSSLRISVGILLAMAADLYPASLTAATTHLIVVLPTADSCPPQITPQSRRACIHFATLPGVSRTNTSTAPQMLEHTKIPRLATPAHSCRVRISVAHSKRHAFSHLEHTPQSLRRLGRACAGLMHPLCIAVFCSRKLLRI
jgi:hypothetical protein